MKIKVFSLAVVLLFFTALTQTSAEADTLTIIGSSNSQNPILGSSGQIGFLGQAFNNNFNVTAVGQTFDFVFGQYQIQSGAVPGIDSGCTDGPCVPITLTGSLTTPIGALSFSGFYEESTVSGRELIVDWLTGSGPFVFATPEGGVVIFTMELVDFFGSNPGATPVLFNQSARATITGFQPGGGTPTPEPASMILLGSGLAGGYIAKRRKRRKTKLS